jgi:hypothetical protein
VTVAKLIARLQRMPSDALVVVPAHDHHFREVDVREEDAEICTVAGRKVISEWDGASLQKQRVVVVGR